MTKLEKSKIIKVSLKYIEIITKISIFGSI